MMPLTDDEAIDAVLTPRTPVAPTSAPAVTARAPSADDTAVDAVLSGTTERASQNLAAAARMAPEQAAKVHKMARDAGLSPWAVEGNEALVMQGLTARRNRELIAKNPVLATAIANNPAFADVAFDDMENADKISKAWDKGGFGAAARIARQTADRQQQIIEQQAGGSVKRAPQAWLKPELEDAFLRGVAKAGVNKTIIATELGLYDKGSVDLAVQLGQEMRIAARRPMPEDVAAGLAEIKEAGKGTFGEALAAVARNPRAVLEVSVESLAASSPGLVAGVVGSMAGPLGTASGAAMGSFAVEYASVISEALGDTTDPQEIYAAMTDDKKMAAARKKAVTRGVPIAVFDGLTAGLAGRLLAGAKGTVGSVTGRAAGELGLQAGGGGAGEAVAGALVGEFNWGDVLLEAFAEIPSALTEVPSNYAHYQHLRAKQAAGADGAALLATMQQAAESLTLKRDPVAFNAFFQEVAGDSTVFVDREQLLQVFAEAKLDINEKLPSAAAQLNQATPEGIEIPIAELVTNLSGSGIEEQLVQHLRMEPNAMTIAEGNAKADEAKAFIEHTVEQIMGAKERSDQFLSEIEQIENDVVTALNSAWAYGTGANKTNAKIMGAWYATVADKWGATPLQIRDGWAAPDGTKYAGWKPQILGAPTAPAQGPELSQGFDHGYAMLNIGLDVGAMARDQQVPLETAKAAIEKLGAKVVSGEVVESEYEYDGKMVKEMTFVPHLDRALTDEEVNQLAVELGQEAIGQYAGGEGKLLGPNAAAWGDFNPEFFKDQTGVSLAEAQKPLARSQSARRPTTKKAPEDHLGEVPLTVDYTKMEPEKNEQNMKLVSQYPGIRFKARKADGRVEEFIQHVTNNLLWLHDQIPADIRQRSKMWYDGARAITDRWTAKYGKSDAQIAAVLAIYSPQKDWFINVSLAERTLDIVQNQQNTPWSPEMSAVADKILADEKFSMLRGAIEGKKLSELKDRLEQAAWLRTFDEAHNNRGHRLVTPEGGFIEFATSVKGAEKKTGWPGFGTIIKALYVIDDGSPKIIDNALGGEHKVRSFYNNIFHPTSDLGFVTIDTHAVAAGLLRPLSGNSLEVSHNFGSSGSAISAATGMSGTYAYYQEAYRRAAEARGLLPREMQSITWEAVRELYTMGFKHDTAKMAVVDKLWSEYEKGKRDLESVRAGILNLAGGVEQPSWVGRDPGISPEGWASTYTGELLGDSVPGRDTGNVDRGTGGGATAGTAGSLYQAPEVRAGAVSGPVTAIHFSKAERPVLSSSAWGTGMKGAEGDYVRASADKRLRQRIAFYVNTGNGIVPESDVGSHAHLAVLENLYDADADVLKIWRNNPDERVRESAVLDAGFDGYLTRTFGKGGAVVMLGQRNLPVEYLGNYASTAWDLPKELKDKAVAAAQAVHKEMASGTSREDMRASGKVVQVNSLQDLSETYPEAQAAAFTELLKGFGQPHDAKAVAGFMEGRTGKEALAAVLAEQSAQKAVQARAEIPPSPEIPAAKALAMELSRNPRLVSGQQSIEGWKKDLERIEPETAKLVDWSKFESGKMYYKADLAATLWQGRGAVDTDSAGFKKWSRDADIVARDDTFDMDFESEKPVVVQVIHGTTGDFTTFDRDRANVESDMGAGFYATNADLDASVNYAGEGPDLTSKLARLTEQIADEEGFENTDPPDLIAEARKRLAVQNQGFAMSVWMRFEKPFVLGGPGETQLTYETPYDEETDEYGEEAGTLVDFIVELRNVAEKYGDGSVEELVGAMLEKAQDYGRISATDLFNAIRESEEFSYYTDDEGDLVSKEIFRQTLENLGYDGVIDQTVDEKFGSSKKRGQAMRGVVPGTKHFIVFNPEQIKSAISNTGDFSGANILFAGGPKKGSFSPATFELRLLADADLSTFLHEASHFFLAAYTDMAAQPGAPKALVDEVNAILGHLGAGDVAAWRQMSLDQQRPYHEAWAEQFEQYAMTGKAPSLELDSAFKTFANWLKKIYVSLKTFVATHTGGKLQPDTAAFFDRMLATEEQIATANAARSYTAMFKNAAEAGMTDQKFADYMALSKEQAEDAEAMLRSRSLRDMAWLQRTRTKFIAAKQAEAAEMRKAVRDEIEKELAATPLRRAAKWLKHGEMAAPGGDTIKVLAGNKLQISEVEGLFPEGALTPRPDLSKLGYGQYGMLANEGLAPDLVAEMFEYRSGESLVRDLLEMKPFKEEVESLTDTRMLEEHSEMLDPDAIAKEADAAIHNDARTRMVATELAALNNKIGSPAALMKAAKAYATQIIETKTSKTLKPWAFAAAETRAGKSALALLRKGKRDEAAEQKRVELVNHTAAKLAYQAEAELKKTIDRFKKIAGYKDDSSAIKSRDAEIVSAIRAILADFGIGTKGKTAREYLAVVQQHNPDLGDVLSDVIDSVSANAKDWREMKISELRDLSEEIEGLWFLAKRSKQIEIDGKLITLHEAQQAIYDRLDEIGIPDRVPGEGSAVTAAEKRGILFDRFVGALRRVEAWVGAKDGTLTGPFRQYMWNPIRDAADAYRADKVKYLKAYRDLLTPIAPTFTRRLIDAPEIGYVFGKDEGGMGKTELLHAILHTGNDSNKRKLLLGRGWATERQDGSLDTTKWDSFLQRMYNEGLLTEADYDFAQGVWDLLESMKPLAQKAHRDVYGKYFNEVTANEFTVDFGLQPFQGAARTYAGVPDRVTYRGGYVPAMTDPLIVRDQDLNRLREGEEGNMAYAFPTTAKGFTKGRVEYNKPLKLDLRTLSQHIDKVLLFAHMTRPVNDVRRVMSGKAVAQALGRVDPQAYNTLIMPWLNRAAKQVVETPTPGREGLGRFWSVVRSRAGMAAMFANIANTVQQITGLSLAAVRVRPALLVDAMAKYIHGPKAMLEHVTSKSSYMQTRVENEVSAMSTQINDILLNPSVYESAKEWTIKHSYFLQSAMDNVISPVVWLAGYNQAIEAGLSEVDAVRAGDSAVRETQGSMAPEDIAAFETGSAFYRMFVQFAGYFNMNANLLGTEFVKLSRDMGLRKGAGRGLYVLTLGMAAPAIIGELIIQAFRGGPGDDDGDGEYLDDWLMAVFGYGPLRYATAMVPGFGTVINAAVNTLNNKPYDDRISTAPAISMIESATKAPVSVYKAIAEDGKPGRAVKDVATLISMSVGLPASGLARPVSYAVDVATGNVQPTGQADAVRGIITGAASPASKQ